MLANWLETGHQTVAKARLDQQARAARLVRENARLIEENVRLWLQCEDLAASAEFWIRLYETALERANRAEQGTVPARPAGSRPALGRDHHQT